MNLLSVPTKAQIKKGSSVSIETKKDQGTGNITTGIVEEILTSSEFHPYGIKVKLTDGQIGRVKSMEAESPSNYNPPPNTNKQPDHSPTTTFEDLKNKEIPKLEDQYNEFKEFYQYDKIIDNLTVDSADKEGIINKKKREVQERFVTAICSFGNKNGGFVYLGIRADGNIAGMEKDRILENFDNYDDDFANHIQSRLDELIQDNTFVLTKLHMIFRQIKDKTICVIQVLPSNQPLYLHSNRGIEFYVRGMAPRAQRLEGIETVRYIKERFSRLQ